MKQLNVAFGVEISTQRISELVFLAEWTGRRLCGSWWHRRAGDSDAEGMVRPPAPL